MGPEYRVSFKYLEDKVFWQEYAPVYRAQIAGGALFFFEDKEQTKSRAFNIGAIREIEIVRMSD